VLAGRLVQGAARGVVARDQHRVRHSDLVDGLLPVLQRRVARGRVVLAGVDRDALVLLRPAQIRAGPRVVELRQRAALVDLALAHDLGAAMHADALPDGAHPLARPHRPRM
jgi:hypothetical protein